jgi:predicted RNase H-like nuclease (RuvC/YqgF family)
MEQTYTSEEIRQLLLYVKEMQNENEELRAKIIAMDAYVKNSDAKVKRLTNFINQFTNVN